MRFFLNELRVLAVLVAASPLALIAQTNVLTQHNDVGRTGLNPTETVLTPANVNSSLFGKLYSIPIDGQAYAQPLYLSSLTIHGVNHSVLFVATEHDSVFAFDTNAQGAVLWQASMTSTAHGAASGATSDPLSNTGCTDVQGPEYGIRSTPVIDPATNTLYTTSRTLENGQVVWRFHALDLTTGNEKFGGPVTITASVPGSAPDAVNGIVTFNPKWHNQRPGLLLLNGTVYVTFGSVCDFSQWHGWVMGYSPASGTLTQTTTFITTPNGSQGGIWMTGSGLAADTENGVSRIFLTTGNGTYDAALPYGTNNMDYSDDILALTQGSTGGLSVTDEFTPSDQSLLQQEDQDVSSGGVVVLPDNLPGSSHPHLLVQISKAGSMVLANRDNLGGYSTTADNDLQEVQVSNGLWGTPAYWNGNLYFWPSQSNLKQYTLTNGVLSTTPTAQGAITATGANGHPFTGTTVSVSSNGASNPIVWANDSVSWSAYPSQYFYAFDGTNVSHMLWSSTQNPSRDNAGAAQKYAIPTIADGKVYLASRGNIMVYGMLPPDFWLTVGQATVSIPPTSSANIPVTVHNQGGFSGAVSFSIAGLPTGVTGNIANGVLTLSVPAAAATGSATVVVTGTSGALTHSLSILLNVVALSTAANTAVETPLSLAPYYNVLSIEADGSNAYYAGLDGAGYAFSATFLGSSLVYAGIPYNFGPANALDSVTSTTISVPALAGAVGPLQILGTAANGNQANQVFTLTYTDGTTSSYTQSISDWGSPQKYTGESIASSMAYRVAPGGGQSAGPFNLYAYTIPFTSGKVLASVTLPNNSNVIVLAATLPTYSTAQTITFNPIAAQTIGVPFTLTATSTSGLAVYYTSATTSVCTVSGSTATVVAAGTCTLTATQAGNSTYAAATPVSQSFAVGSGFVPVSLSSVYNVDGIVNNGSVAPNGGLDGASYAYSETLLGASISALNVPFTLGAAGVADAVSSTTIPIPSGSFTSLNFLASGVFGNQAGANFVLTYTDGTTSTFVQSISDWGYPQNYRGEAVGLTMAYRVTPSGATQNGPWYVFAYTIPIASGKTVKSLTLPASRSVVVMAVTMASLTTAPPVFSPSGGPYATAQAVTLSDSTSGAGIYYTTNGTTATSASTRYTGPITVSANETITAVGIATGYANSPQVYSTYTLGGTTAAPTFSLPAGAYTTAQSVTLSDATAGASIYYTTNGTTPTTASTLYAAPVMVSANETISAIAVAAGFNNSAVAVATYSFVPAAGTNTVVNLSSAFNAYAIFNSGTAPTHGGLDGSSYAYAGATLPTSITLAGIPVTLGPVAAPDAVSNKAVTLPAGQYGGVSLLAAATYGPLLNQQFVVTYTDGTTTTFTQSMSDWGYPQKYAGETSVVSDSNRIIPQGTLQAGPWYIYGYSFALNAAKTVASIKPPATNDVAVYAIVLTPKAATAQTIAFAAIANQAVGTSLTLTATATSGGAVTFVSSTTGVCTVSGSTASLIAAGTCAITANQAGNSTYAAATPVTQSFSVH